MRIPVSKVMDAPAAVLAIDTTLELPRLKDEVKQLIHLSPVNVKVDIAVQAEMYHLSGDVDLDVTMRCSRCLQDDVRSLHVKLDEILANAPLTEEMKACEVIPIEEKVIDLKPIIESSILLALPMVPLCDIACKGLCPECGANLNEGDCGCTVEMVDTRLAKLQEFFDNENKL